MPSELKRGAIRLLSNYMRLGLLLLMGVLLVPVLIAGVGTEAFGLVMLLGSAIGFAEMCKAIVRASMSRELGAAYNSSNPEDFPDAFNAAIALSAVLAAITLVFFIGLWFALPLLSIPPELFEAARWLLVMQGCYSVLVVLLGPQFNMYKISERMVLYNLWSTLSRTADVVAAVVLFVVIGIQDPANGLILFAIAASSTSIGVLVLAVVLINRIESRLVLDWSRMNLTNIRKILPTAGWNVAVVTATNLHIRIDHVIMNLFFGLAGNAAFALAVKLTSYVRILAFGGTDGLDVVSARLSHNETGMTVNRLLHHATRMHAALALPAGLVVFSLAGPLMQLWVGRATATPEILPDAVLLAQILVIGMTARGISDCWTRILYGAGHVSRYGPLVISGGVCNPILAIGLIWLLPESSAFKGPAIAFASILFVVHFLMLPFIAARCLSMRVRDIFVPLLRPAVAAIVSSSVLVLHHVCLDAPSLSMLFGTLAAFAVLHAVLCWFFVLDQPERSRFSRIVADRTGYAIPGWARA